MGSDTLARAESSTAVVAAPVLPGDAIPHIARPATTRNEAIDVVRLIAAAAIVYIHAVHYPTLNASRNLFRFAVPFYLFASFYYQSLSLRRKSDRTLLGYIAARFRRLYLPFLAWSVIYLIARDVKRVKLAGSDLVKLQPGLLWRGIEYHLWFLPYLLGCSIILAVIHWTLLKRDRRWRWPLIVLAIAAGFYFSFRPMPAWNEVFDNPSYAYVQYWRATPAACWGLAFAWFMTMGPELYAVPMAVGMAGILLTVICSVWQAIYDIQPIPRALTGLGTFLAALAPWKASIVPTLAQLGRWSFGIYLCHVLIAEFVRAVANHMHLKDSPAHDMLLFAMTLVGSAVMVLLLGRSRWLAWLNG